MFKASAALAFVTVAIAASSAQAQEQSAPQPKPHFEFIVNSGTVLPTGAQRDAIKRANLTAAQLSYVVHPAFAITASIGWARTRDVASIGDPKLDMFSYDVGGEVRANRWIAGRTLSFSPFAGVGAGGRSYNYRSRDVDATHNVAGYASAGGEVGIGSRVRVRLEARDYVTGFKPLSGAGSSATRNDLSVMAGLRLKVR
jgi:hypothetical protein